MRRQNYGALQAVSVDVLFWAVTGFWIGIALVFYVATGMTKK